jgi:hypothetical protein
LLEATPVRTTTPGLDPEVMIANLNIAISGQFLNMSDWTRHAHDFPRSAN